MAAFDRRCLFCKTKPWTEEEVKLLDFYSLNLRGRLDSFICDDHNLKQTQRLPAVREKIRQETKRRTVPRDEACLRLYMDHYREMQADQKSSRCCVVM